MSRAELLPKLIRKARGSNLWLFVLNFLMARIIPFNTPHGFRIQEISDEWMSIIAPYRRSNHNHIRGIHACAIATAAEFSAGFLLLTKLDPVKYRLIMGRLEADYSFQAKKDLIARADLPTSRLVDEVIDPLGEQDSVSIEMITDVLDVSGNEVARVMTEWQVKRWDRVRTEI